MTIIAQIADRRRRRSQRRSFFRALRADDPRPVADDDGPLVKVAMGPDGEFVTVLGEEPMHVAGVVSGGGAESRSARGRRR
jgi:hypothetical protein